MRNILTFALCCLLSVVGFSQEYSKRDLKKISHQASLAFDGESYEVALEMYLFLDSVKPANSHYNYMVGATFMRLVEHREKSLPYFQKALKYGYHSDVKPLLAVNSAHGFYESDDFFFNIARAYHLNYKFDKAIDFYNEFLQEVAEKYHGHHEADIAVVKRFIENCETGRELLKDTLDVTITNLGPVINTQYEEIAPVLSADEKTLIFTSRRPVGDSSSKDENDMFTENTYVSYNLGNGDWTVPSILGETINSIENESAVALSPDGHKLIIYKNNHHGTGDLYYSLLDGEDWGALEKLPEGINTKSLESSASITPDKKTLYFTSTRPGGIGGEDIYVSHKDSTGNWGMAKSVGLEINTKYDDTAPYIHPDGKTLYFSSKGHQSMGGFDIFKSIYDEENEKWGLPVNVGHPINTPENDVFFVWTADGKRAYFSTHHEDSYGGEDIYMLQINDRKIDQTALILIKGTVKAFQNEVPVGAKITIVDNATQETVGVYESNGVTGRYTLILKPGKDYGIIVEAESCLPYTANINVEDKNVYYEKSINITLQALSAGSVAVLNNVFFDYNSFTLKQSSFSELDKFYKLLMENPKLIVELAGHTDSDGKESYNFKLSQKRAQAVVNYFRKKGVAKGRLIAHGYGEGIPVATNDTEEGKAMNRRTELIIHSSDESDAWKKGHYNNIKEVKVDEK